MMERRTIQYTIELLSDWHVNNGLSGGAESDAVFSKDDDDLPLISGKTIKGLLKDSLEEIRAVQPSKCDQKVIEELFGKPKQNSIESSNAVYFSDATLNDKDREEIINSGLQSHLYRKISSTSLDDNGIAMDKSLRTMEVCMPITLGGEIERFPSHYINILTMSMSWTRQLGMKRNRGFGRCVFKMIK